MKMNSLIVLVLFIFFGCAKQEPSEMKPQQQETAKTEIKDAVSVIFQSLDKMDVETLMKSYSDEYGFILLTTDASILDSQENKKHQAEWFKSLSSLKVTTINEEFRFLPGNIVICAWQGKFEMTLKTDVHLKIDKFGVTFIFSKIDNLWKVIYQHSSSLPPVQQKSNS